MSKPLKGGCIGDHILDCHRGFGLYLLNPKPFYLMYDALSVKLQMAVRCCVYVTSTFSFHWIPHCPHKPPTPR